MIRIQSAGGRVAFVVAGSGYHILQAVAIGVFHERGRGSGIVEIALLLGCAAPLWLHLTRPRLLEAKPAAS